MRALEVPLATATAAPGAPSIRNLTRFGFTAGLREHPFQEIATSVLPSWNARPGASLLQSVEDARDIIEELTKKLSICGSIHDPYDPVGRLLFNVLSMVTEFESDLILARTREGM